MFFFYRLGALSANGITYPFDEAANGYVRGESIAVMLLQRAKSARRVYAKVIAEI